MLDPSIKVIPAGYVYPCRVCLSLQGMSIPAEYVYPGIPKKN